MFLHIFCLLSLVVSPQSIAQGTTYSSAKPGCERRCGNVQVSYPFGIGNASNCSLNSRFDIQCNTSFNPPKSYLGTTGIEVIGLSDSAIYVKYFDRMAIACYDMQFYNKTMDLPLELNFSSVPYTLSDANQIISFGCDDLASVQGVSNSSRNNFIDGCVSSCSRPDGIGKCPGNGCCQTSIPKGTVYLSPNLSDVHSYWRRESKFFPCSFAFVGMMNGSFTFRLSDLNDSTTFLNNKMLTDMPLVLDWKIGSRNCTQVKKSTDYACLQNSKCIDSDTGVEGYRCSCLEGYVGNPYLSPGCIDVNECGNQTSPCDSNGICTNTLGSYSCSCRDGYYGDGRKDGRGCFRCQGPRTKWQ